MSSFSPSPEFAAQLDQQDVLASYRAQFVEDDPDLIYLDGNSLGRLPRSVIERMRKAVEEEWGTDLIRGWNKGWWEAPARVGDKIGQLIGAAPGQVMVSDTTSTNLFKLATAALTYQPNKKRMITDTLNFPSDLYILQGVQHLLSDGVRSLGLPKGHRDDPGTARQGKCVSEAEGTQYEIIRISSLDNNITPDLTQLESALNDDTALVILSHVTFKSGYIYDMRRITELAHQYGALDWSRLVTLMTRAPAPGCWSRSA